MKKFMLLILTLNLGFLAKAQDLFESVQKPLEHNRGRSLYLVMPSFMTSQESNINPILVENDFPSIPKGSLNYGIGISWRFRNFEPGMEFTVGNQIAKNKTLGSELLRRPITANIFLHYHLIHWNDISFFPILGFSITDTNLILSRQSPSDDFGTLLRNSDTSINIQHLSYGAIVGFGFEYSQKWRETSSAIRLKFAYRIPTDSGYGWESKFSGFQNSPVDQFAYFFVQLEIGLTANWRKDAPWF